MKNIVCLILSVSVLAVSCAKDFQETLPEAPAVPQQLTATSTSDNSVRFEWKASEGAENYSWVLRDRHFNVVDLGKTGMTKVEISQLLKGDRYTFAVRAGKGLSISGYSDFVVGIPGGVYIPVEPDVPSEVTCTGQTETSLSFRWSAALDAKKYEYILQDDTKAVVRKDTVEQTGLTIDGLSKGMIYFFQVKSLNDGEESGYSSKAMGIAGGTYSPEKLRLLFLSTPDGIGWKEGDRVQATAGGRTIEYICEEDGASTGLFWPEDGAEVPDFGNARIVFPSGLTSLPSSVTEDFSVPMAATSDGVSATMVPLCRKLRMSIISDFDCEASGITLSGDLPFSGNCSVDWTGSVPKLILEGSQGIALDFSGGMKSLGSTPTEVCFPVPASSFRKVDVEVSSQGSTYRTLVEGGMDMTVTDSASCILPDGNDFYSIWRSGNSFTICTDTISKATCPTAGTLKATSINTAFETPGLYFVDNSSSDRTWTYSSNRTKAMAGGTILVGRYRNCPQPVMKQAFATDGQGCFVFSGSVRILNYRIEAKDNSYGAFQGRSGVAKSGTDSLLFQDCTLVNSRNYLTSFNNGTYAVPKAIMFDNCIIRVKGTVINGGSNASNKPEALETLSFRNTVIAPYDATRATALNGCLFNFGSTRNPTTSLRIDMSRCTVFDYQPETKSRGMVEVQDYADFKMDHTAFHHSSYEGFTGSYYTVYGIKASTLTTGGISISACYSNTVDGQTMRHSGGNKSNLAPAPRTWSATVTSAARTVDTSAVDAENDYFPVSGVNAGADYDSKYWINSSNN